MVNMNSEAVEFEIKRLQDCCEAYQQHLDEIIVVLGSKGVLPSGITEAVERLVREKGEMQLVAGRYQYLHEHAMKALNKIDDVFEYVYKDMDVEALRRAVRDTLAGFTEAAAKVKK